MLGVWVREPTSFGCKTRRETIGHEKAGEVVSSLFNQPDFPRGFRISLNRDVRPPMFVAEFARWKLEFANVQMFDAFVERACSMEIGNVRGNYKYSKYGAPLNRNAEQSLEQTENVETLSPNTRSTMRFLDHENVSPRTKNISCLDRQWVAISFHKIETRD